MSLVNEMLNELQKDQQAPKNFSNLKSQQPPSLLARSKFPLFLTLIIMLSVVFITWPETPSKEQPLASVAKLQPSDKQTNQKTELVLTPVPDTIMSRDTTALIRKEDIAVKLEVTQELPSERSTQTKQTIASKKIDKGLPTENKVAFSKETAIANEADIGKPNIDQVEAAKSVIKLSRHTEASRELSQILQQWRQYSNVENRNKIDSLLIDYHDLSDVWLKTINRISSKNKDLQKYFLKKALVKFPKQDAFKFLSVKKQLAAGNYQQALSELKTTNKENWGINQYRMAGFLSQKTKNHQAAIQYYNHLLLDNPDLGAINMAIAISLEAINEQKLAVMKFRRALQDDKLSDLQKQFISQRIAVIQG